MTWIMDATNDGQTLGSHWNDECDAGTNDVAADEV